MKKEGLKVGAVWHTLIILYQSGFQAANTYQESPIEGLVKLTVAPPPLLPEHRDDGGAPLWGTVQGPVIGVLADRHGRRPLLLLCVAGTFLSFALLAAARSPAMILLSRVLARADPRGSWVFFSGDTFCSMAYHFAACFRVFF